MRESYEVYAIRYARHEERTRRNNFISSDLHDASMPMDYFVWLIRNGKRAIVVDTGFNEAMAKRRKRSFLRCPTVGLKMLGVDARSVKDLIITHLHYDHAGNFDLFPAARFHLQDREMQFATGRYMAYPEFRTAYEAKHVSGFVEQVFDGRVAFVDGEAEIYSGITLHRIGGHTMGLQVVRVWTKRGWMVLASDASHYYANMALKRPFPIVFNVGEMVDGWERVKGLADGIDHIIPGHDPQVLRKYRPPNRRLNGIVARLDTPPTRKPTGT